MGFLAEARLVYHSVVIIGDTVPAGSEAAETASAGMSPSGPGFDADRTRALAEVVDGLLIGTAQPVGTAARPELAELIESLPAPVLQLAVAQAEGANEPEPVTAPSQ